MLLMIVCINISKFYSISTKDLSHEKHPYIHICKHSFLNIESWLEKLLLFWLRGLNEWIGVFRLNGIKKKRAINSTWLKRMWFIHQAFGAAVMVYLASQNRNRIWNNVSLNWVSNSTFLCFLGVEMKKCSSLIHSRWSADKT